MWRVGGCVIALWGADSPRRRVGGTGSVFEFGGDEAEGGGGLAGVLGHVVAHDRALEGVQGEEAGVSDVEPGAEVGEADRGVEAVRGGGLLEAEQELGHGQAVLLGDEGGGEGDAGEVVKEGVGEVSRGGDGRGGGSHTDTVSSPGCSARVR